MKQVFLSFFKDDGSWNKFWLMAMGTLWKNTRL